jgi:drug/metabolite transporter (DMT)-like permease
MDSKEFSQNTNHANETLLKNSTQSPVKQKRKWKWRGAVYALLAAFFYALLNVPLRKCQLLNSSEIAMIRFFVQLIIIMPIAILFKHNIFGDKGQRTMLSLRSMIGTLSLMSFYFSVSLINPSDTVALFNCFVIFVAIFARVFLKEKLTIIHLLALTLSMIGIFLISQPHFLFGNSMSANITINNTNATSLSFSFISQREYIQYIGSGFALFGAFAYTVVALMTKTLTNVKAHVTVICVYASYFGLPISACVSLTLILTGVEKRPRFSLDDASQSMLLWDIFYSSISASFGVCAQLFTNTAIKLEDVNKVALLESTDLIFNFLFQYLFLKIKSNYLNTVGALLIFFAILLVMLFKIADKKNEKKLRLVEEDSKKNKSKFREICEKLLFYKF